MWICLCAYIMAVCVSTRSSTVLENTLLAPLAAHVYETASRLTYFWQTRWGRCTERDRSQRHQDAPDKQCPVQARVGLGPVQTTPEKSENKIESPVILHLGFSRTRKITWRDVIPFSNYFTSTKTKGSNSWDLKSVFWKAPFSQRISVGDRPNLHILENANDGG